jgi:inner membrane transporter RhtA
MKLRDIPPVPAVLLAILSVQAGAAVAKSIFPVLGPVGTTTFRIVLSAAILMALNRPNLKAISTKQWKLVSLYGLTLGAMNLSFYLSLARIPLGLAVTLEFIGPLLLAVATSRKAIDFLWITFAALGIMLIAPWSGDSNIDLTGALLALLAGGFWAAYIIIGGKTSKVLESKDAVSVGMAVASVAIVPFAVFLGNFHEVNPKIFLFGLSVALLSGAIPFTLEMKGLKHLPAKTFSILMSLEPAVAAFCGLLFLSENLTILEWLAIALVIIASAGTTLSRRERVSQLEK